MPFNKIIGLMSGTSLDGLDVVYCEFSENNQQYSFKIIDQHFESYPDELYYQLKNAKKLTSEQLIQLDFEYGKWMGKNLHLLINDKNWKPEAIASHGYTVYHNPKKGYTHQIGRGSEIAAICKLPVVSDFRSLDIALGGQGAPLVPIGDEMLFNEFDACLNLGGIANISFKKGDKRFAFDICPFNLVLNHFAEKKGLNYDDKGQLASMGNIETDTYIKLCSWDYFVQKWPKSLGAEAIENEFIPLFHYHSSVEDNLRTAVECFAEKIAQIINEQTISNVLVTGGGAYNNFFIQRLQALTPSKIEIPHSSIVDFKEALIFAFLGYLRLHQKANTMSSVTGALPNSAGGCVYFHQ